MNERRVKRNQAKWEPLAAFACFVSSILSLTLGFAFTTNWLLNAVSHPYLHIAGITLLIIGIPILILGGHFLDLMDKKNKKSDQVLPEARFVTPVTRKKLHSRGVRNF